MAVGSLKSHGGANVGFEGAAVNVCIISLGALVAIASPVAASTITYTISGTVIAGLDSAKLFGGGDLAGKPFSAVESFNPAGAASAYANASGSGANGGWSTNGLSFAEVVLTIGDESTSFSDYTSNVSSIGGTQFNSFVQSSGGINKNDIGFYIASKDIKADYTQSNSIQDLEANYAGYYTLNDSAGQQVDYANFEVIGLVALSAVPLPPSAAMFGSALLAFGGVGYVMKRKRSA